MTTDELQELTTAWQGLPWEARDLFARWLAGVLTDQGIDKGRRLRMARRDAGMSQAALEAATRPAEGVLP